MKLVNHFFSYSFSNIVNAAVPFFLLPILTKYLSPTDFGLLSLAQLLMTLSLPFVLINVDGLFTIEYSNLSEEEFGKFLSTILLLPVFGFVVLELSFYIFQFPLAHLFKIPAKWVLWMPFFAFMQCIPVMVSALYQAKREPLKYGLYKVSMTLINLGLSIFFVVSLKEGWEGRLWGILSAYILFTIIGLIIIKRLNFLKFVFISHYAKDSLRFGIPLIPHAISGTLLAMSDRLFMANMMSPQSVGIYSAAFQIAGSVSIVTSSVNQAWIPMLYERLNKFPTLENKKEIVKQTYLIMLFMMFVALVFIVLVNVVYHFFINANYHAGKSLAMLIAIGFMFQGFYFMVTNYIFYVKKTYLLSLVTMTSFVLTAGLNYTLIPKYGMYGSAFAMVTVWAFFFLLSWHLANKVYPMPWGSFNKKEEHENIDKIS